MAEEASLPQALFAVNIDLFDGPMDLLLHLVKQKELPIERVSLAMVTSQFLLIIDQAQDLDFELAGEYLVVAATLLAIKSSVLLQQPVEVKLDGIDEGEDPEEELLRRLVELERFREGAAQLGQLPVLGTDVFAPVPEHHAPGLPDLKHHDALLLGRAIRRLLDRSPDEIRSLVITTDAVPIAERMLEILSQLQERRSLSFESLVGEAWSISRVIGTFLALLELSKRQVIVVDQAELFGPIAITLIETSKIDEPIDGWQSEFDQGAAS
jgi:segregation and condensation protein A